MKYLAIACHPAKLKGFHYREAFSLLALLILLVPSLYFPALNGPFLFDDTNNIEQNPAVHIAKLSFSALEKAVQRPRPVAVLSFALDYYLHGLSPFWFRTTNILIHICTAMVLYTVLSITINLLFDKNEVRKYRWFPLISAILWAIHPIQVQSVTYIVQRMNSLAGLFLLLSLLCYIRSRLSKSSARKALLAVFCLLLGLLAIGSKPNAAVLPILFILYEWIFLQKSSWKWIGRYLPFLLGALVVLLALSWYFLDGAPLAKLNSWYAKNDFTPIQRVMTEFRVVILYLSLIAFPHPSRLNIDHDILLSTSLTVPPSTALSLAVIIIFLLIGIVTVRKLPLLTFGIFWFFTNLVIESTIIPLDFIFEHRNYIPSMMLIPGIVFCLRRFLKRDTVIIILTVLLTLWSAWTYDRNSAWKSGIALWQDSAEKSPNKPRPHESLAYYLEKEDRDCEALRHYARAAELDPNNPTILNNLGNLNMKTGDFQAALKQYSAALRLHPQYKEALNNMGNALSRLGQHEQAIAYYNKALKLDPNFAKGHTNLANALAASGRFKPSMLHYDRAIELTKNNIEIRYNRSILLLRLNRFAEAEQALQEVVQLKRGFKEAYNNLGVAQEHLNKLQAAMASYQQALLIDPHFKDAQQNLARLENRLNNHQM
ncbi:MAG: tetratricopeptide repeat protein [Candidatus Electrothrix sp. GW3-4]|uniref:tetratricopeptide repeat protein n=1 Tax=Candidatus Electrothrix sp. GW3-4 TaxID=3126740 RepID=UPI0030CAB5FA